MRLTISPLKFAFQSTLPAWGATRVGRSCLCVDLISIHAPRMGSDKVRFFACGEYGISIHAPRMGSDNNDPAAYFDFVQFQSTLPAWGATVFSVPNILVALFQSTLPAWGATLPRITISFVLLNFNPRSPHGERLCPCSAIGVWGISIHAPRMGSDMFLLKIHYIKLYFNPRSPHGERRKLRTVDSFLSIFQSTLPAWGATFFLCTPWCRCSISIHAPRMGSDRGVRAWPKGNGNFNPRSPHGERLLSIRCCVSSLNFNPRSPHGERRHRQHRDAAPHISIHAPRMGSDTPSRKSSRPKKISIHAPRMGSDVRHRTAPLITSSFQSTLPAWGAT